MRSGLDRVVLELLRAGVPVNNTDHTGNHHSPYKLSFSQMKATGGSVVEFKDISRSVFCLSSSFFLLNFVCCMAKSVYTSDQPYWHCHTETDLGLLAVVKLYIQRHSRQLCVSKFPTSWHQLGNIWVCRSAVNILLAIQWYSVTTPQQA